MPSKKTSKATFESSKRFSDLENLPECALASLKEDFGYEFMSEQQALYMQAVINGHDMLVRAGTGSGKTLGFLLPLITTILGISKKGGPVAVVLSPARELAEQTLAQARKLSARCGLKAETLVGGVRSYKADVAALNGVDDSRYIIIATPGRLMDHIENNKGFKEKLAMHGRVLVLDEIDRLIDPGFKPAMLKISALMTHPNRQTLLFTATATSAVREASKVFLREDDAFIDAGSSAAAGAAGAAHNANVKQEAILLPSGWLLGQLWAELEAEKSVGHTVVFVQTATMAMLLASTLKARRGGVYEIHSRMEQNQRSRAVRDFSSSKTPAVIVATDVFARGIDVQGVTLVLQLGIAPDNAQVAHRVGRTGRGGAKGRGLMLLDQTEAAVLTDLISKEKMPIHVRATPQSPPPIFRGDNNNIRMACKAFIASIGFYKAQLKRLKWKGGDLVPNVASMFAPLGVTSPAMCPVPAKLIKKMGLVPGHGLKTI